ncbi:hypothetical protein Ava_B0323 (plasmid) [Trichormus variabilis ATCC 29413]|uniref:Uncharacterized protein n=2 Tax=Anabaena variabilis TaxID=264691 RepID=Q3M1V3_TRIV2|nr:MULTISPECIES: hypothetical protein [Nostocaceae]ABA25033.1 hypothetical protein Ava_B0323 [Trichormus variabilis ATCC 29413]MBC1217860.1 hypothetical protein [Trichormus variabilis ARAD]MBC1259150.1 hypothetical protein [Trichormus variabilis V5]MBC1270680.1 hypothetical protein [Trichormus variabilis FSR]MBC1305520.1 hypothetical protein [Trichormus variabilis N2B]
MSQIEIAQIIEQIKQEITVDSNGQGKASIRATARLADVNDAGLLRSLKTAADNSGSKLVEKLIRKGFGGADILSWSQSGIPDIAVAAILHYYGYEAGKRCSQQAKLACEAFESIGVRAWMQDIMGWTKTPTQQSEQPPVPALPPVEQRLHTLVQSMKILAELTGGRLNPYMEQQMKDYAANLLAEYNRKMLTPSEERWLGVVNFAESQLGRNVPTSGPHYRGHLGTWVRTFYSHLSDRQETRIVQGTQQKIYVYPCHDPAVAAGLTKAIEEFFAHPEPAAKLRQAGAFSSKKVKVSVL